MKYEYPTDHLYFKEAEANNFTKGELANRIHDSRDALNDDVKRRARAVLGMRGVKNPERVQLNVTQLRDRIPLVVSNEQLAEAAKSIAYDTLYHSLVYF